jgi:hypothetical protein
LQYGCNHNSTSKKCIWPQKKTFKIREIFMFYHLKPWKSWQVVVFSFIWMSKNSNQKFIRWNFKFKFWFSTFESEHLLCQKESILQRTIKRTHIIRFLNKK